MVGEALDLNSRLPTVRTWPWQSPGPLFLHLWREYGAIKGLIHSKICLFCITVLYIGVSKIVIFPEYLAWL